MAETKTKLVGEIVGLAIAAIFLAQLLIPQLVALVGVNISALTTAQQALVGTIVIIMILSVIIIVLKKAGVSL